MEPPKKKKPGAGKQTGRISTKRLRISYRVLRLLQAPFGFVFWLLEQQRSRLQDRMENEGASE
jgi:hypothetical protein